MKEPGPERLFQVAEAFRAGLSVEDVYGLSFIDPWFLDQIEDIIAAEKDVAAAGRDVEAELRAVVGQVDDPPQAEPDAAGVRPHGVDRTARRLDAIGAQLAGRLGQFGQVQRNGPTAFDAGAAGPVG